MVALERWSLTCILQKHRKSNKDHNVDSHLILFCQTSKKQNRSFKTLLHSTDILYTYVHVCTSCVFTLRKSGTDWPSLLKIFRIEFLCCNVLPSKYTLTIGLTSCKYIEIHFCHQFVYIKWLSSLSTAI